MEQQFLVLREHSGGPRSPHQQQQHQQQQEQPERFPPRAGGSRKRARDDEEEDEVTDWSRVSPQSARGRGRGHRSGYKRPWRGNSYYRR
jgi:hypothetical protein